MLISKDWTDMKAPSPMNTGLISVLIITACFLLTGFPLSAAQTVIINPRDTRLPLGDRCETLEDKTGKLTLDRVITDEYSTRFRPSSRVVPNYGFTKSAYWVRCSLKNNSAKITSRMLEVAFPLLDRVEFYLLDKDKGLLAYESAGRDYPFSKREVNHRNFVFQVSIPPGDVVCCYIRILTDDGMIFPINTWADFAFIKKVQLENLFFGIYYGIILVMIFYNLFIFLSIRDRNYLFYVLFILFFGLFQMSMNGLSIQYLWPESTWWGKHANPVLIALSCFWAGIFSVKFLQMGKHTQRLNRAMLGLIAASLLLAVISFKADYLYTIAAGQVLPVAMIVIAIPAAIFSLKKGNRSARFYLIAWTVFFAGIILSALRVAGTIPHNLFTEYGLQIGSGIQMVMLSLALADRISIIESENERIQKHALRLEQEKVEDLNRSKLEIENAHALLSLSEEKYRLIVEGSSDIIFTLDSELNFITANNAIATEFKLDPGKIAGLNFMELLYTHEAEQSMFGILTKEKLDEFTTTRKPVNFRAQFISSINNEPKEMQVHLEHLNIMGKNEILGKMSHIIDDSLLNFFISEQQKYAIGNYLITADEITHRITRNLKKYISPAEIRMIQLALREIIINAIEHGNLNISFEEKSAAIMDERYFSLIRERQTSPETRDKKVAIEYSINSEQIVYTITDEGEGFRYDEYLSTANETVNNEFIPHGRGLLMTRNIFDEVKFNEKGNTVILVKSITPRKC